MPVELKEIIHGRSHLQIGKNGVSEAVVSQIKELFKKNLYLKIRFLDLGIFNSMTEGAKHLSEHLGAKVVDIRGKTLVLKRLRS